MQDRPVTKSELDLSLDKLSGRIQRLEGTIDGPPYPGLEDAVKTFMTSVLAVEKERDRVQTERHQENKDANDETQKRVNFWGLMISLFGLVCAACMLYLAIKSAHVSVDPARFFKSQQPNPVVSYSQPQESSIPPL